jgi:N-methylhydantoinase A
VIIPALPGALSALGILFSDVVKDYSRTVLLGVEGKLPQARLAQEFAALEKQAAKEFHQEGWHGRVHYNASVDIRYRGQGYELNLPLTKSLLTDFEQEHRRRYGYAHPLREVELVTLRLRAIVKSVARATKSLVGKMNRVGMDTLTSLPRAESRGSGRAKLGSTSPASSSILYEGKKLTTKIYSRDQLVPGKNYFGPAIVTEYSATTVIPPRRPFQLDAASNLIVTI